MINRKIQILFYIIMVSFIACGGGSSSGGDTPPDDGVVNALASAYPSGLAISSPMAGQAAAASVSDQFLLSATRQADDKDDGEVENDDEVENEVESFEEVEEQINAILNATALADCFDYDVITLRNEPDVACYGPEIDLHGTHPDSPGTDLDDPASINSDTLPGGDVGLWDESEDDGEACLAAKVNAEFYVIQGRVNFAMLTMASAMCYANNSGLTLPAAGESLDLTSGYVTAMTAAVDEVTFTPDSLVLARLDDTAEGNPVYEMTVSGESTENGGMPVQMKLQHIPTTSDNSTYQGLLQTGYLTDNLASTNCGAGEHTMGASVLYQKASASDLKVRFKQAVFCGEATEEIMYDTDGEIDGEHRKNGCANDTATSDATGWGDDYTVTVLNLDPTTGYGNFSYAWQAGRCDSNTRTFKAAISATGGSDGGPGGCGYFGYGDTAQTIDAEGQGDIESMICNWTGPGNNHDGVEMVQRQCVDLDDATGLFVSDSSRLNISYAPTNSCDDAGGALDCGDEACPVANDLLDIAEMTAITVTEPDALP